MPAPGPDREMVGVTGLVKDAALILTDACPGVGRVGVRRPFLEVPVGDGGGGCGNFRLQICMKNEVARERIHASADHPGIAAAEGGADGVGAGAGAIHFKNGIAR